VTLSKSDYILFLKHPAWLWLKKNQKELLPEPDLTTQHRFTEGNAVEALANTHFPGAVRIGFTNYAEYRAMPRKTLACIEHGATTLLQARFEVDQLTAIVDVIEISGSEIHLTEIKSSNRPKEEHYFDLAFQSLVLEKCGYLVTRCSVMHINSNYVRTGELTSDLFTHTDCTQEVANLQEITRRKVEQAFKICQSSAPPSLSPSLCRLSSLPTWLEILAANQLTQENSVWRMPGISAQQIAQMESLSIQTLPQLSTTSDLPSDLLNVRQTAWLEKYTAPEQWNTSALAAFLQTIQYPIAFFDYETSSSVIPPYVGTKPRQQVPCQYSLHIRTAPEAELQHVEFLHTGSDNPMPHLLKALERDMPLTGSVVVWYAPFESSRNKEMAELYPSSATFLVDLMDPFAKNLISHPHFKGSNSIKNVLPVLVPNISYKELAIGNGAVAQILYQQTISENTLQKHEKEQIWSDLRTYCCQDTYALFCIYQKLCEHTLHSPA
jgi:hypothetical protein